MTSTLPFGRSFESSWYGIRVGLQSQKVQKKSRSICLGYKIFHIILAYHYLNIFKIFNVLNNLRFTRDLNNMLFMSLIWLSINIIIFVWFQITSCSRILLMRFIYLVRQSTSYWLKFILMIVLPLYVPLYKCLLFDFYI